MSNQVQRWGAYDDAHELFYKVTGKWPPGVDWPMLAGPCHELQRDDPYWPLWEAVRRGFSLRVITRDLDAKLKCCVKALTSIRDSSYMSATGQRLPSPTEVLHTVFASADDALAKAKGDRT